MSQENVQVVRGTFDAMRRRDHRAAARGFHADAVWHNTTEFPGPRSCVGRDAIMEFWKGMLDPFDGDTSVERLIEGEDTVVLGLHSVGRGKASGVPIDVHWSAAFHLREGKISRVDVHGDWAKALHAAGMTE